MDVALRSHGHSEAEHLVDLEAFLRHEGVQSAGSPESVPESFGEGAIAASAEDVVGDRIAQISVEDAAVPASTDPF